MDTRIVVALGILSIVSTSCFADLDYKCLNNCQQRGFQWGLCQERCSYGASAEVTPPAQPQSDFSTNFNKGYGVVSEMEKADAAGTKAQLQTQTMKEADAACKRGDQQACRDLRMMLFSR